MDLHVWLEKHNPDLYRTVMSVRAEVASLLESSVHPYFTDHSVNHSEHVIRHLGDLAEGVMGSSQPLCPMEGFFLMAAAYLHDVGMQDEKSIGSDKQRIRDLHHDLTAKMILDSVEGTDTSVFLGLPPDRHVAYIVALVAMGHRKVDLNGREYREFDYGSDTIRPRLLAAMLRFADELDVSHERVEMKRLKTLDVPPLSQLHWYLHHYVSGVRVKNGYVILTCRIPTGADYGHYRDVIPQLVLGKIQATLKTVQDTFQKHGVNVSLARHVVLEVPRLEVMPADVVAIAYDEYEKTIDEEIDRLVMAKARVAALAEPRDLVAEKMIDA